MTPTTTEALGSEQEIVLVGGQQQSSRGVVQLYHISPGHRFIRAITRGILGLVLTALFVFIPILHFLLVPLGILGTLTLALHAWSVKTIIESGRGTCPQCSAEFRIFRQSYRFPLNDVCEKCGRRVLVQTAHSAAGVP